MRKDAWEYLVRGWESSDKDRRRSEEAAMLFFMTISRNEWEVLSDLVERGCSPNLRLGHKTPLMQAAESGAVDCAKLLLALGSDFGSQDEVGRDVLHYAVESRCDEILDMVMARKPRPKRLFADNSTALIMATKFSYVHGVRRMVQFSKSWVDMYDRSGRTALWHVLSKESPTDEDNQIAKILLDSGADPDMTDLEGVAPREAAASEAARTFIEQRDIEVAMEPADPSVAPPAPSRKMRL